jgi:hypothetical protein
MFPNKPCHRTPNRSFAAIFVAGAFKRLGNIDVYIK